MYIEDEVFVLRMQAGASSEVEHPYKHKNGCSQGKDMGQYSGTRGCSEESGPRGDGHGAQKKMDKLRRSHGPGWFYIWTCPSSSVHLKRDEASAAVAKRLCELGLVY